MQGGARGKGGREHCAAGVSRGMRRLPSLSARQAQLSLSFPSLRKVSQYKARADDIRNKSWWIRCAT